MKRNLAAAMFGVAAGFVVSWARLSDPNVISDMLLLREPDVFLLMGSAICVAAIGSHLLRALGARSPLTGELIGWQLEAPQRKHVIGSALFGLGWSVTGTCPGPLAAMIGQGSVAGLVIAVGLANGVVLQGRLARAGEARAAAPEAAGAVGL